MKVQCGLSAAFAAQALGAAFPATTYGDKLRPLISSEKIQKLITTDGLMGNLEAFQAIAEANGGNRAFGLPGYAASVDYIVSQTKNASNFRTWVQDFPALFNRVDSIKFSISNSSLYVIGLSYSPSTSAEGLTAPLVLGVAGAEGCTNAAYENLDVRTRLC
ncbi:hypothetical protein HBH56_159810 [Parastagonospora nodorum]|uniref:Uncharacterized protein n=1 Tax=Phaeosphaeria nodorum (strain SN15 / ATCC MYA-4574 / FGSC 10173) TaxID=321614 RepID=A0A7U2I0B6_PHANO|nr:hypothetical protein HBH56_159810 [Parastagonospora nodorum]QRC97273.1 hypothetical protein JI435_410410 [Parastagonospora nodorum SN15]KAH3922403.1 hypothetical protein HBH54_224240 [Parastagonospora nodorum]KAH3969655.1 hypothetical protein HBH52_170130 [Parastagonospora nodorum]KAH3973405.1 hypothetical protein HBH51_095330 [Parastagonospora nodorum]